MKNICIIGSGSWGTALAINLSIIGHNIKVWSFMEDEKDLINNEHRCKFLPNVVIPDNVYCTTSLEEAIERNRYYFTCYSFKVYKRDCNKI